MADDDKKLVTTASCESQRLQCTQLVASKIKDVSRQVEVLCKKIDDIKNIGHRVTKMEATQDAHQKEINSEMVWREKHEQFKDDAQKAHRLEHQNLNNRVHQIEMEHIEAQRKRDQEIEKRFNTVDKMAIAILIGLVVNLAASFIRG